MNNQKNLDWIQMLRGIAALLVVLCHARYALLNTEGFGLAQQLLMPGASGVDLFFLISGFIMCYSTAGSDGSPAEVARFAIKRFARVWPVYAVVTLVAIFALSGGVEYFHDPAKRATFWHSIAMVPANPRYMPYFSLSLEQGWTLLFEMYFYLMFVVSMLFRRLRWVALAAWVGLTVIAPQLGAYDMSISRDFGYSVGYLSIVTSPFVLEFVAGVLIGWLYLQPWFRIGNRQLAWHGLGLGVAFALWAIYSGATVIHGPTQWGWPLALMVTLMALASKTVRIPVPPFFLWLGAISYSLYLTHLIAQGLVRRAMEAYGLGHLSHTWGFIFISTAFALPLAALSHRLLEQGLSNLVRNALLRLVPAKPQPQQPVQAAAPTIAHLSR